MIVLRTFFDLNRPVIQFAYGLSFFVMGLAIALQSRSSSRLELARSLAWLAAFGIAHSLYVWGELFSYVHEAYLTPQGIFVLHIIHLTVLSISFGCLFEFGIALLRPLGRGQWLHQVTIALLVVYAFVLIFVLPGIFSDPHVWHNSAEALARYLIGLPGGLLAAYGLREQTYLHIAPLEAPDIVSTLRMAGIALALYSIFEGLLPPPVPFFPGNILNSTTFEQFLSVPALVFLSLIGLVMAVAIIRALEIFQMETDRRIEAMEQQQILLAERQRIARELHDGAIQTVYTAGLLVESAQKQATPNTPIANRLDKAVEVLQDAILDLRRNLNTLNPQPGETSLADALGRIAADPRYQSMVKISLDLNLEEASTFTDRQMSHILAIVNEAISNVIRHAHARNVWISARQVDGSLNLSIMDDGSGMNGTPSAGYGLRNMRDRARLLGGNLDIKSESGRGTRISLSIPCIEE